MHIITTKKIDQLQKKVFSWFKKNKRDLPWRNTRDPYKILVSETMLQQTQVDRVIPKYNAFVQRFPDFATLARAQKSVILRYWSGLGYNSRALRLRALAKIVMQKHAAVLPKIEIELLALPGVGPYTARAIQIFAWNKDVVCIDTNIRRIFIHELGLPESISLKDIELVAEQCLPVGRSRDWHNALMDYGAIAKTARVTGVRPVSRQSTFKNSRRYYRGQIIKLLTQEISVSITQLKKRFAASPYVLHEIVEDLEKEGFVRVKKGVVRIGG